MSDKRVVCLNCMDGRVQLPVIAWITENHSVDNVDMITEPGMDGHLADQARSIDGLIDKIKISIEKNGAEAIFVVGHWDCRGNPVKDEEHQAQVRTGCQRLREHFPDKPIQGLWVDQDQTIHPLVHLF